MLKISQSTDIYQMSVYPSIQQELDYICVFQGLTLSQGVTNRHEIDQQT